MPVMSSSHNFQHPGNQLSCESKGSGCDSDKSLKFEVIIWDRTSQVCGAAISIHAGFAGIADPAAAASITA